MSKTDTRTECLIYGYVRLIKITHQITPISIIQMIIQFYYKDTIIVYFDSYGRNNKPDICYTNIECNTQHQIQIESLNDNLKETNYEAAVNSGICFVKDIYLPQNIIKLNDNLNEKHLYDIIFTINENKHSCAYIIDSQHDEFKCAYYYSLPPLSNTDYLPGQYLLYSSKHGLISINEVCLSLKFTKNHDNYNSNFKWSNIGIDWKESRGALSCVFISQDKLLFCGGRSEYKRRVDMYDFENKQLIKLSNMNENRSYSGICFDKYNKNRVFIGNGFNSKRTFEYLDISKNNWISLSNTKEQHDAWPLLYMNQPNIVHIASPDKTFERIDIREGKWIKYIPNNYKTFNELFGIRTRFASSRLL